MTEKPFQIQNRKTIGAGEGVVVEIVGFLDAHTVSGFERHMNTLVDEGASRIVVDLDKLIYISSAGIGALMSVVQRLRRGSGDLVLLRPSQKVFKILEILGFTKIFKIAANEDEALAGLQPQTP